MRQQAIVIGLGQFGMAVAQALTDLQVEVFAVDIKEDRVRLASNYASETAIVDAMDEAALSRMSPERRDFCLCAIGDEAKEASIICTALLRQLGAKRVIARANDDLHARILQLLGAEIVVNPEREFGERFANRLLHSSIKGEMPLGQGLWITEIVPPALFLGHSLVELRLPSRYEVTVVAIRRDDGGAVLMPSGATVIEDGDVLVLVGREGAVNTMMERS